MSLRLAKREKEKSIPIKIGKDVEAQRSRKKFIHSASLAWLQSHRAGKAKSMHHPTQKHLHGYLHCQECSVVAPGVTSEVILCKYSRCAWWQQGAIKISLCAAKKGESSIPIKIEKHVEAQRSRKKIIHSASLAWLQSHRAGKAKSMHHPMQKHLHG